MIIYRAINKINGKMYIGQTIQSLRKRKSGHRYEAKNGMKRLFCEAVRKYGIKGFNWEILEECKTKDILDKREKHYIEEYGSLAPNGYNMTLNTCGNLGYDFSGKNNPRYGDHRSLEEIHGKEKARELKENIKDRYNNPEYREHFSKLMKKRLSKWNPMNNEKSRMKLSRTRTGGNNPAAIYKWKITLPYGAVYETDCMRQFCKEHGFARHTLIRIANGEIKNPRDKFYRGWIIEKTIK